MIIMDVFIEKAIECYVLVGGGMAESEMSGQNR